MGQVPNTQEVYYGTLYNGVFGWLDLGTWIWIWVIKIQIPCLDSLQWVKDLDLTNLPRILNLKILEFKITFKPIEF